MNEIANAFLKISAEKFQFLVDEFGFRRGAQKSEGGLYRVLYESETTAVEISLEWKEQYVYVELFRLINGRIKENPLIVRSDSELTVHNLEDLIAIRAPQMSLGAEYFGKPITVESLEYILSHQARALKELGADVLQGDFAVFSELESVVKARVSRDVSAEGKTSIARTTKPSKSSSVNPELFAFLKSSRVLNVSAIQSQGESRRRQTGRRKRKIYVGNLSYQTTEGDLATLFAQVGQIDSVNIITDRDTGRSKGFAFVEMSGEDADKAITQLNGTEVGGRTLTVNEARPREEAPPGKEGAGGVGDEPSSRN